MRRTIRALFSVLALCVGLAVVANPASAVSAVPWAFVQVQATAHNTGASLYVPLTASCPFGYTPISGGISGPGQFEVVNEYATYWNDSFSEQIVAFVYGTWVLTVECASADQVGAIQVTSADFSRNSSGQAGGWVPCPTGTRVVGGGADWNLAGARSVQYAAPSDDGLGWYAAGESDTGGNSLHVEAYCVAAGELAAAQRVTQAFADPPFATPLAVACPTDTRTLTGGVYAALPGAPVDPGRYAGYMQDSYPDLGRFGWHALAPWAMPAGTTVYVTAWCVPASVPTVVITSAPPTATAQTHVHFSFTATDPAGYPLNYTCILDGIESGCDGPTSTGYDPVGEGTHTFTVAVRNGDSEQASASYRWTVDTAAPTATATAPTQPFTLAGSTAVSWTGHDNTGGSGVASYQVRERTAAYNGKFTGWSYPSGWQELSPLATGIIATGLSKGIDYCFAVRATDRAGNTSPWTTPRCTARALDDRSLSVGAGWARGTAGRYWNHTITTSRASGATATRTGVQLDRVGIVATRGPGMGTIAVYVGATRIGQISLSAPATHDQDLILLPRFGYRNATVRLKVVTGGKPVQLDGLALSRS